MTSSGRVPNGRRPVAQDRAVATAGGGRARRRGAGQGLTIRGFSKETEHGHTAYEVEMTVSGHGKDGPDARPVAHEE